MTEATSNAPRRRQRTSTRRTRVNPILNGVDRVDWKDVDFLQEFLGDRGKISTTRVSRPSPRIQRQIRIAVKRARQMALLPYS